MRDRPTSRFSYDRAAFLYVAVTLLLGIGSLHSQNNLLFLAFGVAVGVLLVNGAYGWSSMRRVRLGRHTPSRGEVGKPLTLRYHVATSARFLPAAAVVIEEVDAPEPCVAAVAVATRASPARASATITPRVRGELRLNRIDVSSRYPFGAVKKTVRFSRPGSVLVRPAPVEPDERALLETLGSRRTSASLKRAGVGDEAFGLREYTPGDPVRRIAWRASARHGDLLVRQHAAASTSAVRLALRLDPQLTPAMNEEAISLAAGTLALLNRRGRRAALYDPARPGVLIARLPAALDALARIDLATHEHAEENGATLVIEASVGGAAMHASGLRSGAAL